SLIITTDAYVDQWFMNWRIGRYYLPEQDFWILQNNTKPNRVDRVRRDLVLESRETPLEIPIFREGRILWLIEPGSAFHKHIAAVQNLTGGKYVFYSDITPDSPPFTIDGVQIIPKLRAMDFNDVRLRYESLPDEIDNAIGNVLSGV